MTSIHILNESEFKYGTSDYAVNLRKLYGIDGYNKYRAKVNSIMDNPIVENKKAYIETKEAEYKAALANLKQSNTVWSNYKKTYNTNLNNAIAQNGGVSLTGTQKHIILENSGNGAVNAKNDLENAQFEADHAFSCLKDAKLGGMQYLS